MVDVCCDVSSRVMLHVAQIKPVNARLTRAIGEAKAIPPRWVGSNEGSVDLYSLQL